MRQVAIDTETTGLTIKHGCRAFMVTACDNEGLLRKWHFRINPLTRTVILNKRIVNEMYEFLCSYDSWIFHNAMFDLTVLSHIDDRFNTELYESKDVHDTMLTLHCYKSNGRLALKPNAFYYLKFPESDEKDLHDIVLKCRRLAKKLNWATASVENPHRHLKPLKKNASKCDYWLPFELAYRCPDLLDNYEKQLALDACITYALGDVERTMGLFIYFQRILHKNDDWKHYEKNRKCIIPIWAMQNEGFPLLTDKIPKVLKSLEDKANGLLLEMKNLVRQDFNPNSGKQVADFLFVQEGCDVTKFTAKGCPSTDKDALVKLSDQGNISSRAMELIKLKLAYTKINTATKNVSSYDRFCINGRLYGSLRPAGTKTLRLAMSDPNLQNVSKLEDDIVDQVEYDEYLSINLRKLFGPRKGYLLVCIDYTQLQLRIFATACQDKQLLQAFDDGADIHTAVAQKVYGVKEPTSLQRRAAKAINFGIIFGAGERKIDNMTGQKGLYKIFKDTFPLVNEYIKLKANEAKQHGYIRTLGGYPLQVEKNLAYKACNIVVQGTEGEMVKDASCNIHKEAKHTHFKPVLCVHDEFIFESKIPMTVDQLKENYYDEILAFENHMNAAALRLGVKTTTDVNTTSTTWADAK